MRVDTLRGLLAISRNAPTRGPAASPPSQRRLRRCSTSGHGWLGGGSGDFPGVRNVHVLTAGHEDPTEDTAFESEMDGLRLSAQVSDFVAGRLLAWSGQGIDISTYHVWVISGHSSTSRALAGFAARGAGAIALRETDPGAAQRALDRWAAGLKTAAEGVRP